MSSADVLILGAGLAGLACRAALAGARAVVTYERDAVPGGLVRVYRRGEYIFDTAVHVLFFRSPSFRDGILSLLDDRVHRFAKRNLVWQRGVTLDYPYQFNTHALPAAVRDACIREFVDNPSRANGAAVNFEAWLLAQFGAGFHRHFFEPYNRKLYGVELASLEAAPMIWTIPAGDRDAVLSGSTAPCPAPSAINAYYPAGALGIQALAVRLEERGEGALRCGERAVRIDHVRKRVHFASGSDIRYEHLVSTLPLPNLLDLLDPCPPDLIRGRELLSAAPVTVIRVGARRTGRALEAHWTYFPDPEVPFYRMTRLEQISGDLCPAGGAALLLECPGHVAPDRERVLGILQELGVLQIEDVEVYDTLAIPNAYVRFLHGYAEYVGRARQFLAASNISSIGRYGEWRYANIEQTIASGLETASTLAGGSQSEFLARFS